MGGIFGYWHFAGGYDGSGSTKPWDRSTQQRRDVEVLRWVEHNRLPTLLGTSTLPSGLSGIMRRAVLRYNESG